MGFFSSTHHISVKPVEQPANAPLCGASTKMLKGEDFFQFRELPIGSERLTFALVADGHGGREAAMHCTDHLLKWIAGSATNGSSAVLHSSVVAAFKAMHEEVRALPACNAGCTLTVCALNMTRRELSVWNVGDSLGLLIHAGGYLQLGSSHRLATSLEECPPTREQTAMQQMTLLAAIPWATGRLLFLTAVHADTRPCE